MHKLFDISLLPHFSSCFTIATYIVTQYLNFSRIFSNSNFTINSMSTNDRIRNFDAMVLISRINSCNTKSIRLPFLALHWYHVVTLLNES